jgi:hypothetical protein
VLNEVKLHIEGASGYLAIGKIMGDVFGIEGQLLLTGGFENVLEQPEGTLIVDETISHALRRLPGEIGPAISSDCSRFEA